MYWQIKYGVLQWNHKLDEGENLHQGARLIPAKAYETVIFI